MNYQISEDRKRLTIKVTAAEQKELTRLASVASDLELYDFLEPIVCNSELDWVRPEWTGDLTDAPMLGIVKSYDTKHHNWPEVSERWAFMDYQVRSVLEDLRDKGEAIFSGGD